MNTVPKKWYIRYSCICWAFSLCMYYYYLLLVLCSRNNLILTTYWVTLPQYIHNVVHTHLCMSKRWHLVCIWLTADHSWCAKLYFNFSFVAMKTLYVNVAHSQRQWTYYSYNYSTKRSVNNIPQRLESIRSAHKCML